jgi:hypothetical protein
MRLADEGWEVSDVPAIVERLFHYDVVVFEGAGARKLFEKAIDDSQPQAVRISVDETEDLRFALAGAGIPPGIVPDTSAA